MYSSIEIIIFRDFIHFRSIRFLFDILFMYIRIIIMVVKNIFLNEIE
jgi:hypothetical protein